MCQYEIFANGTSRKNITPILRFQKCLNDAGACVPTIDDDHIHAALDLSIDGRECGLVSVTASSSGVRC